MTLILGTKSVVHKDGTDNMNCLFAGRKRMIMWHPKYEKLIETAEFGPLFVHRLLVEQSLTYSYAARSFRGRLG